MKTIDQLLSDLVKHGVGKLDSSIPLRDKKILVSLDKQIQFGNFLTKNQGNLLIKILKENSDPMLKILGNDYGSLEVPTWSQSFRIISPVRKIYRKKDNLTHFFIEFTYNKKLQQVIFDLGKQLHGGIGNYSNKTISILLTEKNIHLIVSKLKPLKFEISEEIQDFYNEICQILDNPNPVTEVNLLENKKIFDALYSEIGGINQRKNFLVRDRGIRFQYKFVTATPNSLTEKIACREQQKIWIKNTDYKLDDIMNSLSELKRFPCLVVLGIHDSIDCLEKLKSLAKITKPSVYFRFDSNTENNVTFNKFINENKFNNTLTETTNLVVLANNKLPKFLFTTNWYPKSVLSFTNNFRTNKTTVWCDAVDLQIFYTDKTPMIGGADVIV